jgi:hypothetical protein
MVARKDTFTVENLDGASLTAMFTIECECGKIMSVRIDAEVATKRAFQCKRPVNHSQLFYETFKKSVVEKVAIDLYKLTYACTKVGLPHSANHPLRQLRPFL